MKYFSLLTKYNTELEFSLTDSLRLATRSLWALVQIDLFCCIIKYNIKTHIYYLVFLSILRKLLILLMFHYEKSFMFCSAFCLLGTTRVVTQQLGNNPVVINSSAALNIKYQ